MVPASQLIFKNASYLRRISQLSEIELSTVDSYLQLLLQQKSEKLTKTHFFHDRYENIYLDENEHPVLDKLLSESLTFCAELLAVEKNELDIGYWFNLMAPGQVTTLHTHDNLNELISGVVYLTVPENSGDLVLKIDNKELIVPPVIGNYLFFDPETPHRVTRNKSNKHRLSIGMNIGLKEDKIDWIKR